MYSSSRHPVLYFYVMFIYTQNPGQLNQGKFQFKSGIFALAKTHSD